MRLVQSPRSWVSAALAVFVSTSFAFAHAPDSKDIPLDGLTLRYSRHLPSVSGRFLLTVANPDEISKRSFSRSTAYSLETDGRLKLLKAIESRHREAKILNFRPVDKGVYGYTVCSLGVAKCDPATIRFVSADGADVELTPVPDETMHLNFHDFLRLPNGNFLFPFATFDARAKTNDNRLEEWNEKGRVVFAWRGDDHLKAFGLAGLPHINSVDVGPKGHVVISTPQVNTVYEIERPSGRINAKINSNEWKFPNDPLGGFKYQHSARVLPNGNYLIFDNGDGVRGRSSRAVEYAMDFSAKTATLVWEYRLTNDPLPFRKFGGMAQRLSNGNTVITWGTPDTPNPDEKMRVVTEVDAKGRVVRELTGPLFTYRIWFEETEK